ncbi:MAG: hypothetical protein WCL04_02960, partial [Verrucomicrobiota bacterium]
MNPVLRSLPSLLLAAGTAAGRTLHRPAWLSAAGCLLLAASASAQVATNAVRQSVGGIDLVVLKTGVQEVVTIRGSLAAGDSLSPATNPAIASLVGGMLDKGTAAH